MNIAIFAVWYKFLTFVFFLYYILQFLYHLFRYSFSFWILYRILKRFHVTILFSALWFFTIANSISTCFVISLAMIISQKKLLLMCFKFDAKNLIYHITCLWTVKHGGLKNWLLFCEMFWNFIWKFHVGVVESLMA